MTEIAKYADTLPTRNTLRDFLEWLDSEKIELAKARPSGIWYVPLIEGREHLFDRYLGINARELECERRALLARATPGA